MRLNFGKLDRYNFNLFPYTLHIPNHPINKNGKSIQVRIQGSTPCRRRQGKRREEGEEGFQGRPCREFNFSLRVVHLGSRLTFSQEKKSKKVVKEPTPESSSSEEESDSDEEDSDSDSDAVPTTDIPAPVVCFEFCQGKKPMLTILEGCRGLRL